jgi:hypothetical protein
MGYRVLEADIRQDAALGRRLTVADQSAVGILWGMTHGDRAARGARTDPPPGAGIENMVGRVMDQRG